MIFSVGGAVLPRSQRAVAQHKSSLYSLRGTVWILVYLFFVLAPLFALLFGSHPPFALFGRSSPSRSGTRAWRSWASNSD